MKDRAKHFNTLRTRLPAVLLAGALGAAVVPGVTACEAPHHVCITPAETKAYPAYPATGGVVRTDPTTWKGVLLERPDRPKPGSPADIDYYGVLIGRTLQPIAIKPPITQWSDRISPTNAVASDEIWVPVSPSGETVSVEFVEQAGSDNCDTAADVALPKQVSDRPLDLAVPPRIPNWPPLEFETTPPPVASASAQ